MKTLLAILALSLVGCTSVPVAVTSRQEAVANAVEDALAVGLVPVLTKNASYLPIAQSIARALGSFSGDTITPADVDAFLSRSGIAAEDARVIAGVVNAAWGTYVRRYSQQVNASVRPDVALFLGAVSRGILSACAAVPK